MIARIGRATKATVNDYSYDAAAGQSGATTTPGNSHQLISLSGTINGTTESAGYTYDLQHRLATSAQTSNGASAQRRFAYDRWGNRTAEWDAVAGGNQIQSIALQQTGGAPTNRITSVTNSGVTANYLYDAAGNVTNDGVHSYTYDAGNRLGSVDGGATAQYSYDHQNRRVKKVAGGATTHYVWEGGQVIAEHDGAAVGPWTAKLDYVYARGVLIATRNYTIGQQCTTDSKGVMTCTTVLQSTAVRYYLGDLWSTRLVLDASGNVIGRQAHLPFGEEFAESGTQEKHHFTSYEAESESGTDYAVNRQYSQSVGRFGSADPYQASGYLVNPQSWNRYSYVENDPIHNVDPLGLVLEVPSASAPDGCFALVGGGGDESTPTEPGPPNWWTGFNSGDMADIVNGFEEAVSLLGGSACASGLASRQFGGRTIDVSALYRLLLLIRVKDDIEDPTVHGPFRIFNGQTSTHPGIVAERILGRSGGTILGFGPNADIFLFKAFFGARGGARISAARSRGVALIHELIHLQGFLDSEFTEGDFRGSKALSTFIIHKCISPLLDHNDLAIVVQ